MNSINFVLLLTIVSSVSNAAVDTVLVGHAANFSDVSKSAINPYNKAVTNGLEAAIDHYSAQLKAKGLKIKIQNFDYGNKEILSLGAAREIVASPVVAAIGFYESGQALLAAPELQKSGVPLISPVASATRLFSVGPHFHPMSFSNQDMGFALAHMASQILKAKSALVVTAVDCAYCADLAASFESKAKGIQLKVERVEILNDDSTFEKVDQAIAGKKFDVVVIPNHELTSAKVIAHLMKAGIKVPFLGGDGWGNADGSGFFQIVNDPTFTGYCVGHWHPTLANKLGKEFIKVWKSRYGEAPSTDSAMAYESMRRLILAVLKVKSVNRKNVQEALLSMRNYNGITGDFQYPGPGKSPKKSVVLLKSDMKKKSFRAMQTFLPKD